MCARRSLNCGFEFPLRRITVNLAPADLRKAGPGFDLALARGGAGGVGPGAERAARVVRPCGELGLDGSVRPVRGALVMAAGRARGGCGALVVPRANAAEAALVDGLEVAPIETPRSSWSRFLAGELRGRAAGRRRRRAARGRPPGTRTSPSCAATSGPARARGRGRRRPQRLHGGPPGSGKSMAGAAPAVDPSAAHADEALGRDAVHSVAGRARPRPARAHAPLPRAASLDLRGGPDRRRPPPRRARRALHSTACCSSTSWRSSRGLARGAAPAARGWLGAHHARAADRHLPRPVHAGRREQSLSLRAPWRPAPRLHLPPAVLARYRAKLSGAAARPHRHRAAGRAAVPRRAARRGRPGAVGGDPRAGDRRSRTPARAG